MNEKRTDGTRSRAAWIGLGLLIGVACGDTRTVGDAMVEAGRFLQDGSPSDAQAQSPTECRQWAIASWDSPSRSCDGGPDVAAGGCTVPAGWEPYDGSRLFGDLSGEVHLRRCIAR